MAKVTTKLQVTVPKAVADRFGIKPGDEISWEAAGAVIRVVPVGARRSPTTLEDRLKAFDEATARQRQRQRRRRPRAAATRRGWQRDELYERARAR